MLAPTAPPVVRHVHILHIEFPVVEIAESVHKGGLSRPDGLDFRACEHQSRLISLQKLVVEGGSAVLYFNIAFRFGHILTVLGLQM